MAANEPGRISVDGEKFEVSQPDGKPLQHRCVAGTVHGFLTLDTLSPAAAEAGERVFADVADLLDHVR